jgi:hypothetical protein
MENSDLRQKLPGYIATGLLMTSTALWTLWGTIVMYSEGWGSALPPMWLYLVPALISLALTLFALTWPRTGGWLLIALGGMFGLWWLIMAAGRARMSFSWVLTTLPVASLLVISGIFLILEARYRDQQRGYGIRRSEKWIDRNLRYVLAVSLPLFVFLAVSVYYLPRVLARVDDGDRQARLIRGNGVTLIWAPEGPGWNWRQPDGWYPSWSQIALFGVPPTGLEIKTGVEEEYPTTQQMASTGLCGYLSADGMTLMDEPQGIWRLPTVDEIVRSLVKRSENAGCLWNGTPGSADCEVTPDKETPLWAPDASPIYYWAVDEFDQVNAWYVSYNGSVHFQPKEWSNPRHSYRCVHAP